MCLRSVPVPSVGMSDRPAERESRSGVAAIRRLGDAVVLTQIAMAASASCLLFASARVLERPISPWWYAAAFLASWCVYLRDSAASCNTEDAISQPRRAAVFRDRRFWSWWLPAGCAVGAATAALAADPRTMTMVLLAVMAIVAGMHARQAGDEPPATTTRRSSSPAALSVKRFASAKSIIVSIAWAGAAVGLCLLEAPTPIDRGVAVASMWLAALLTPVLLADSLLLDLRDRTADRTFGLHTIAVRVGPRGVHGLVGLLLAAAATVSVLGAHAAIDGERWLRLALATTLGLALPWFGWRSIRRDEVATAFTIMAWRFLAALAVL